MSLRRSGVGAGFVRADATLPKGHLKLIAFANPPGHFKADIRGDYLNIRLTESKRGNESMKHSTKAALSILYDVNMTPEAFRARLKQFLSKRGFQLNSGTG